MADPPPGLAVRLRQAAPIPLDLAFTVAPGEVMALVGASGSGKTTTLRAIAGFHRPAESLVRCGGEIWSDSSSGLFLPVRARRFGLVAQAYALFPHLTALGNVMEALHDRPSAARRAEAVAMLAKVHLGGLEQRKPHQLSGGQQQRVAIARALARRPKVMLLDEPFSALDRPTRRNLQRELLDLRNDLTMPVILVTHDIRDAAALASHVCVIARGTVQQSGPMAAVMANPATPEVADLLDSGGP